MTSAFSVKDANGLSVSRFSGSFPFPSSPYDTNKNYFGFFRMYNYFLSTTTYYTSASSDFTKLVCVIQQEFTRNSFSGTLIITPPSGYSGYSLNCYAVGAGENGLGAGGSGAGGSFASQTNIPVNGTVTIPFQIGGALDNNPSTYLTIPNCGTVTTSGYGDGVPRMFTDSLGYNYYYGGGGGKYSGDSGRGMNPSASNGNNGSQGSSGTNAVFFGNGGQGSQGVQGGDGSNGSISSGGGFGGTGGLGGNGGNSGLGGFGGTGGQGGNGGNGGNGGSGAGGGAAGTGGHGGPGGSGNGGSGLPGNDGNGGNGGNCGGGGGGSGGGVGGGGGVGLLVVELIMSPPTAKPALFIASGKIDMTMNTNTGTSTGTATLNSTGKSAEEAVVNFQATANSVAPGLIGNMMSDVLVVGISTDTSMNMNADIQYVIPVTDSNLSPLNL